MLLRKRSNSRTRAAARGQSARARSCCIGCTPSIACRAARSRGRGIRAASTEVSGGVALHGIQATRARLGKPRASGRRAWRRRVTLRALPRIAVGGPDAQCEQGFPAVTGKCSGQVSFTSLDDLTSEEQAGEQSPRAHHRPALPAATRATSRKLTHTERATQTRRETAVPTRGGSKAEQYKNTRTHTSPHRFRAGAGRPGGAHRHRPTTRVK